MQLDATQAITALSVLLNFVLGYLALRPSADRSLAEASTMLLKPLQERIDALEQQNRKQQDRIVELEASDRHHLITEQENVRQIAKLQARIDLLVTQLRAANLTPADFG